MEFGVKRRKVKILDYFGMIESNSDKCQAVTDEARRDSIRAVCNLCRKTISGTYRVKSNFITHMRKTHPEAYMDYQIKSGRQPCSVGESSMLSIASLDEPNATVIGLLPTTSTPIFNNPEQFGMGQKYGANNFNSFVPRHLPTSTVWDQNSIDGSDGARSVKADPDNTALGASQSNTAKGNISSSPHQHNQTEALLNFIVGDLIPMEVVESPRFARFLQLVSSDYQLPSKDEVRRFLDFKLSLRKAQLSDQLKGVNSMCLSQEVWISNNQQTAQMTIAAHYVENWSYNHLLLTSHSVDVHCLNNKEQMVALQQTMMAQIPVNSKILMTVNGLMERYPIPGFLKTNLSAESRSVSIGLGESGYASLLDGAVTMAINSCGKELLDAIPKAAALIHTPGMVWAQKINESENMSWFEQLGLIDMVLQIDESTKQKMRSASSTEMLTDSEILILSKTVEVLRPFQEVAKRVRNTDSVTCSLAFASIKLLKAALCDFKQGYPDFNLVAELLCQFQRATSKIDNDKENAYTTATILDPRFKLQWCDSEHQSYFKKSFIETVKKGKFIKADAIEESIKCEPFQSGGFFTRILKQQPESIQAGTITSEVLRYLEEPLMVEDCDIMSYWQANETNFPHLSVIAQSYLAIPTSLSDVKCFYHLKGETMNVNNTALSGESFQKAVQLRCNLT